MLRKRTGFDIGPGFSTPAVSGGGNIVSPVERNGFDIVVSTASGTPAPLDPRLKSNRTLLLAAAVGIFIFTAVR